MWNQMEIKNKVGLLQLDKTDLLKLDINLSFY